MKSMISMAVLAVAFAQSRPAVELERAITQEQVEGDLNAAIAAYQKIAGNASAPREVRAKALLQLAGCYEKLGRQAGEVYQRIVRDYADQPAATHARTRLAAMKKEAAVGASNVIARKITTRYFNYHSDGKSAVYRDEATHELIAGDVAGKVKHVLLKPDDWSWWMPSKDFSMVAIAFRGKPDRPAFIAVINTDGTGYREVVTNDEQGRQEGLGFDSVMRVSWSWDKRDLVVAASDKDPRAGFVDRGSVLSVSVADGKRRRLAEIKGGFPYSAMFSPDGRFVAYEVANRPNPRPLQIFVMPAGGGKPSLIHEERGGNPYPGLLDWTADGRYLAITASTAAGPALHLFPIKDGETAGPPILVRPGRFYIGLTTASGALSAWLVPGEGYVARLASLDADGRPGFWQPIDFGGRSLRQPYIINWSPDSNQIVYPAENDDVGQSGGTAIRVRNLTTGQDRLLHRNANRGACLWGARSSRLICGDNLTGESSPKVTAYSISWESGAIQQHPPRPWVPYGKGQASRDGRALYVGKAAFGGFEFVRWEVDTGQETVLERAPSLAVVYHISPDESWLVRSADWKLEVRPASGGDWKPLATVNKAAMPSSTFYEYTVTPDSKWVVYRDVDSAGKHGLFRVSISGGAPQRLGDYPELMGNFGAIQISPDGRKIIAGMLGRRIREAELWLLENFVPAAKR